MATTTITNLELASQKSHYVATFGDLKVSGSGISVTSGKVVQIENGTITYPSGVVKHFSANMESAMPGGPEITNPKLGITINSLTEAKQLTAVEEFVNAIQASLI